METTSSYDEAKARYLARRPRRLRGDRPSREGLHDRAGLR
jgi:hypothetical protein